MFCFFLNFFDWLIISGLSTLSHLMTDETPRALKESVEVHIVKITTKIRKRHK